MSTRIAASTLQSLDERDILTQSERRFLWHYSHYSGCFNGGCDVHGAFINDITIALWLLIWKYRADINTLPDVLYFGPAKNLWDFQVDEWSAIQGQLPELWNCAGEALWRTTVRQRAAAWRVIAKEEIWIRLENTERFENK